MTEGRKIVVWACVGQDEERLTHTTMDEAIEDYLDGCVDPLPETIIVKGFARMQPDAGAIARRVIDDVLDNLDEEYGDPEGDTTLATPNMEAAAQAFVKAILADYEVWACEAIVMKEVNVAEWKEKR